MSSISVVHHPFSGGSSDNGGPFSFPYSSQDYGQESSSSASATFTLNPASSRPPSMYAAGLKPRTPKSSIRGGSSERPLSGFNMSAFEDATADENEDAEKEKPTIAKARPSISSARGLEVWREIFLTSTGRDKALKLIQYSIKVYLLFHLRSSTYLRRKPQAAWEADMITGLQKASSGLSLSRKCMIMFNWLTPLSTISAPESLPASGKAKPQPLLRKFMHSPPPVLLDLICGLSDDLATFYKLGIVPGRIGKRAERLADWCWFAGTLVDLVEVGVELSVVGSAAAEIHNRLYKETMDIPTSSGVTAGQATDEVELKKLRRQEYWLKIQRMKLLMDLIFVSYDVFNIKKYSNSAKAFTGLASAVLSSMRLYDKHSSTLSRSAV